MQFKSTQRQILDVTVQNDGHVQMACEQAKFFATFSPENAQSVKRFLNANLPEEVEHDEVNLNPLKGNVNDGDEEMEQTNEGVKNV